MNEMALKLLVHVIQDLIHGNICIYEIEGSKLNSHEFQCLITDNKSIFSEEQDQLFQEYFNEAPKLITHLYNFYSGKTTKTYHTLKDDEKNYNYNKHFVLRFFSRKASTTPEDLISNKKYQMDIQHLAFATRFYKIYLL